MNIANNINTCCLVNRPAVAGNAQGGIDAFTKLMLHMDGADLGTIFTDSELTPKTVTSNGGVVTVTAVNKFGTASGLFNGLTSYLSTPDSADWNFGTGDFTIDFWVRFNTVDTGTQQAFVGQNEGNSSVNYWILRMATNNQLRLYFNNSSGTPVADYIMTNPWSGVAINTWYHVAFVRTGTNIFIFIGGTSQALTVNTAISTHDMTDLSAPLYIGTLDTTNFILNGWLDEVRISKGIARWTSNFTPPSAPYTT